MHKQIHTHIYYTYTSYCSTLPMASPQNYINDRSWHVQMFAFLLCSYIKFMADKEKKERSERERVSKVEKEGTKTPTMNEQESHIYWKYEPPLEMLSHKYTRQT